jgi:hypothetical protein
LEKYYIMDEEENASGFASEDSAKCSGDMQL